MYVVCENDGCAKKGFLINTISGAGRSKADLFMDNFGTGAEDPEDFCPECKELGILYDEESYRERYPQGAKEMKNEVESSNDSAQKETVYYACINPECTFFRIALDNEPSKCPMCKFKLSHIYFPEGFFAMHIRNGLVWRCTSCRHITVRHPRTTAKEAGPCAHCGGTLAASNMYEIIVKDPDKVVPLDGSTGGDNG